MRGRDLRHEEAITQNDRSTAAAFAGYEDPSNSPAAFDPTAPALEDLDASPAGGTWSCGSGVDGG